METGQVGELQKESNSRDPIYEHSLCKNGMLLFMHAPNSVMMCLISVGKRHHMRYW